MSNTVTDSGPEGKAVCRRSLQILTAGTITLLTF